MVLLALLQAADRHAADYLPEEAYRGVKGHKKSWRRPTLARPGDALPSAMEPLTSVFGMGTGMTAPPWSPAKRGKLGVKGKCSPLRDAGRLEVKKIS